MKILIASDGHGGEIYADAFQHAFAQLGHMVSAFHWRHFFYNYPYASVYPTQPNRLKSIYYRAQNKLTFGPAMWALNRALLRHCLAERPDLLFVYRGTHVWPSTLRAIKKLGIVVFGYNNDDPFSKVYPNYFWRHFRRGVTLHDHMFAFRSKNLADYAQIGYHATSLLRSYYIQQRNFQIPDAVKLSPYVCEVIFVGHYEADGRDQKILALLENGVNVKLYGTKWQTAPLYAKILPYLVEEPRPLYQDYNLALNSAKIVLVFLSKLNNDTYTQRNFEIPATGVCMVSEYTDDLAQNLFTPDEEAVYFKTSEELVTKVQHLLANPDVCVRIGAAGRARLLADGHEVTDRARQVLAQFAICRAM